MISKLTIFVFPMLIVYSLLCTAAHPNAGTAAGMAPRHGGQLASSDEIEAHLEAAPVKKGIKIYIYPMNPKTNTASFKITGEIQENGKRDLKTLELAFNEGSYTVAFKRKKGFKLFLKVTNSATGKNDLLRFIF